MNTRLTLVATLLTLIAVGCKSKPTLVGDWSGTMSLSGATLDVGFLFGADKTLAVKQTVNGEGSTTKGTYVEEEKQFILTVTAMESPKMTAEQLKAVNETIAKSATKITFTLVWKDADTVEVTQQGAQAPFNVPITLKRKA